MPRAPTRRDRGIARVIPVTRETAWDPRDAQISTNVSSIMVDAMITPRALILKVIIGWRQFFVSGRISATDYVLTPHAVVVVVVVAAKFQNGITF